MAISYSQLVNKNGTIYNTVTGVGYPTPDALAKALGVPASSIQWNSITSNPNYTPKATTAAQTSGSGFDTGGNAFTIPTAPTTAPQATQQQGLTGVPELDAIYNRLQQYLSDLQASGKTINPNIELSPATIQQFLDQAKSEIEPYYGQKIDSMKNELKSSLDTLQKQYDLNKQDQESQFKQNLNNTRETLADQGAAYSGFRGQKEQQLKDSTQRSLEGLGLGAASSAGTALYNANQTLGSRNIGDLTGFGSFGVPMVSTAGAGGFSSGRTISSFTPSNTTGSLEYSQNADVRQLQDFLKQQEVAKRSLSFAG